MPIEVWDAESVLLRGIFPTENRKRKIDFPTNAEMALIYLNLFCVPVNVNERINSNCHFGWSEIRDGKDKGVETPFWNFNNYNALKRGLWGGGRFAHFTRIRTAINSLLLLLLFFFFGSGQCGQSSPAKAQMSNR